MSIFSYVFAYFTSSIDSICESLIVPICSSTLVDNSLLVDQVYRSCVVTLLRHNTWVDLIILDMVDFNVILDMDCLFLYHLVLDCYAKTVTLVMLDVPKLKWKGTLSFCPKRVIYFRCAYQMIEKGFQSYLDYVWDTGANLHLFVFVSIIRVFMDVFPIDFFSVSSN